MRKIININWLLILLLSCSSEKHFCDAQYFKELNLYPVGCILNVPDYKIVDSMRYDIQTVLSYTVNTSDSVLGMNCYIKSYENDSIALFDIKTLMHFQRQEVEFGRDSLRQITETIKDIDSVKVGYLKYIVQQPTENLYEGRIFFYRGRKLVTLWLFEKYRNEKKNGQSIIDCILDNIKFKEL